MHLIKLSVNTMIKRNKKGEFGRIGLWILVIMSLGVIFSVLYAVVDAFAEKQIETGNYELFLIEKRILQSPKCLAYQEIDGINIVRTMYGVLDYENHIFTLITALIQNIVFELI